MKKVDNFDPSKWLVENKITTQSRLNEDEEEKKYYLAAKSKDGKKHEVFKKNPNYIKTTYDSALELINSLKKPKHYIYYVSDIDGNPVDEEGNIINEEETMNEESSSPFNELFIHFNKSKENYTIFAGEEGEVTLSFSELAQLAKEITSFLNQVPDVKKITDLEVRSGMDGLEIQCVFTTSASKEELESMLGKKIKEFK